MDVTCNRCGTVYEFEAGLISPSGTTVKCTECGHLFKVHRLSAFPAANEEAALRQRSWSVRQTDGTSHVLESLAEVIRLIRAGQFGPDDEISRTGQVWKRLGSIAELASVFEPPRSHRLADPRAFSTAEAPAAAPHSDDAPTTTARARRNSPLEHPIGFADLEGDGQRQRKPSPIVELGRARRVETPPAATAADAASELAGNAKPESIETTRRSLLPVEPRRSSRRYLGLLSIMGALLITGSVAAVVFGPTRESDTSEHSRLLISQADRAFASHRPAGFEAAISDYAAALKLHANDPLLLSSMSRAHAVWSQWLRTRLLAMTRAGEAASIEAVELRAAAQRLAADSKRYAERAMVLDPSSGTVGVAWSDALRLNGDLELAKTALERARAASDAPAGDTFRVAALLAIDAAGGDFNAGRTLAEQAVEAEPGLLRTRFLLLQCLMETRALDAARAQLRALRQIDPSHPSLPALGAQLDAAGQRQHGRYKPEPPTSIPVGALGPTARGA